MYKLILILLLMTLSLTARYEAYPIEECPAFNNLKHTKNSGNIYLNKSNVYTILRTHKGQKLILVKGQNPAQRWVDENCFHDKVKQEHHIKPFKPIKEKAYHAVEPSTYNILALSWHNAFCQTHQRKKECKRPLNPFKKVKGDNSFVLHGLWPQPRNKQYCNVDKHLVGADKNRQWRDLPCLGLEDSTMEKLRAVMPGVASDLHKHEWVKHGTCYGTSMEVYFKDSIALVEALQGSTVTTFFREHEGKRVSLQQVRKEVSKAFGSSTGNRVELRCKGGLITELWFHLKGEGSELKKLLKGTQVVRSRCQGGVVDRAGFF